MSNQNRKARIRARQRATRTKYTQAARELSQLEVLASDGPPTDPIVKLARESCSQCGGPIRWVVLSELEELRPAMAEGLREFFEGELATKAEAWVCLECDNAGVFGPTEVDGDWQLDDERDDADLMHDHSTVGCFECGGAVDWIDPAQVANLNREKYLAAKAAYGVGAVLAGGAAVCRACSHIEIHPRP